MDVLAQDVPAQQFNTWIRPLQARAQGEALVVEVANRFKLDWIRAQYLPRIQQILDQLADQPVTLELTIAARQARPAVARTALRAAAMAAAVPRKPVSSPRRASAR